MHTKLHGSPELTRILEIARAARWGITGYQGPKPMGVSGKLPRERNETYRAAGAPEPAGERVPPAHENSAGRAKKRLRKEGHSTVDDLRRDIREPRASQGASGTSSQGGSASQGGSRSNEREVRAVRVRSALESKSGRYSSGEEERERFIEILALEEIMHELSMSESATLESRESATLEAL